MKILISITTICSLLYGCGGGSNTTIQHATSEITPVSSEDSIRFLARVAMTSYAELGTVDRSGIKVTTVEFNEPVSASYLSTYQLTESGCIVRRLSNEAYETYRMQRYDQKSDSTPISAGENLTVTSPQGTWYELPQSPDFSGAGIYSLRQGDIDTGLLPAESILDIPGDTHPPVVAIQLFTPEPLLSVEFDGYSRKLTSEPVTADDVITWDPAQSHADARIHLMLSEYAFDENGVGIHHEVECNLADNGYFEFPDEIKSQMYRWYSDHYVYRQQRRFEQHGNVLVDVASRDYFEY